MSGRRLPTLRLPRYRLGTAMAAAGFLILTFHPAAASWDRAHADGANSGFVDVPTAPAGGNSVSIPGLGHFAPGAGPVIAPDGTVYIGTEEGKLFAFHADGTLAWSRELPGGQAIMASPAIGADGTIYVVGTTRYRDHRFDPPTIRFESALHRFVPGGGWLGGTPFPELYTTLEQNRGRGFTSAPPNIWRSAGVEAVIVPAVYSAPGGIELRLVAFSTSGAVLAETRVTYVSSGPITSSSDTNLPGWLCLIPPTFVGCVLESVLESFGRTLIPSYPFSTTIPTDSPDVNQLPPHRAPLPGVAVIDDTPWVIVSDRTHDIVGYNFTVSDGFIEVFRAHDPARTVTSPPTITRDGHSAFGAASMASEPIGAILFAGPNAVEAPAISVGFVHAAPTRLEDGRLVAVEGDGMVVLRGYVDTRRVEHPGGSIASAAASRTHVFVSTASALYTYDAHTMQEVSRIDWVGGGLWPPVIGPQGHVYAMASNILFVFPPPPPIVCRVCPAVAGPLAGAEGTDDRASAQRKPAAIAEPVLMPASPAAPRRDFGRLDQLFGRGGFQPAPR